MTTLSERCVIITAALLLMVILLTSTERPAFAIEELSYVPVNDIGPSLRLQLNAFLKQNFNSDSSDYVMAETDLNGDNLLEHILKRKNCGQYTNICTHLIIAEKEDELALLSKISAKHLMVGDDESYGIKNLLAFKNPTNDYDFDIYVWSPREKMYILGANEIRN